MPHPSKDLADLAGQFFKGPVRADLSNVAPQAGGSATASRTSRRARAHSSHWYSGKPAYMAIPVSSSGEINIFAQVELW